MCLSCPSYNGIWPPSIFNFFLAAYITGLLDSMPKFRVLDKSCNEQQTEYWELGCKLLAKLTGFIARKKGIDVVNKAIPLRGCGRMSPALQLEMHRVEWRSSLSLWNGLACLPPSRAYDTKHPASGEQTANSTSDCPFCNANLVPRLERETYAEISISCSRVRSLQIVIEFSSQLSCYPFIPTKNIGWHTQEQVHLQKNRFKWTPCILDAHPIRPRNLILCIKKLGLKNPSKHLDNKFRTHTHTKPLF